MDKLENALNELLKASNDKITAEGQRKIPRVYTQKDTEDLVEEFIASASFMAFYHNKISEFEELTCSSRYEKFEDILAYTYKQAIRDGYIKGLKDMEAIMYDKIRVFTTPKGQYIN